MPAKTTTCRSSSHPGPTRLIAAASLLAALAAPACAVVSVDIDTGRAPRASAQAARVLRLVREWGPRINSILYGSEGARVEHVRIEFEPAPRDNGPLSFVRDGVIHLAAVPENTDALLIHDLTHLYQVDAPDAKWLIEGIADYIAHRHFAQDLEPRLHLNGSGQLTGYQASQGGFFWLQQNNVDVRDKGYVAGNMVAASFLSWLELNKDKDIVQHLSTAIRAGQSIDVIFTTQAGAALDTLWAEFVAASMLS